MRVCAIPFPITHQEDLCHSPHLFTIVSTIPNLEICGTKLSRAPNWKHWSSGRGGSSTRVADVAWPTRTCSAAFALACVIARTLIRVIRNAMFWPVPEWVSGNFLSRVWVGPEIQDPYIRPWYRTSFWYQKSINLARCQWRCIHCLTRLSGKGFAGIPKNHAQSIDLDE